MPSACIVDAYVDGSSVQALNNKEKFKASDSFVSTAATILRILGLNSKAKNTASTRNNTKQKRQKSSKLNIIEPQKMPTLSSTNYSDLKQKGISQMSPINEKIIETTISNDESTTKNDQPSPTSPHQQHNNIENQSVEHLQIPPKVVVHPASMGATNRSQKRSAVDFRFGKSIGEGSFSTVYLAEDIHTRKEYAIKVCDKQHIIREKKQEYIKREREILNMLSNCSSFVNLYCTFQDARNLYFVMTYAKNGDLLPYINKVGSFDLACTKFYAAEIILALEEMHSKGVIHRDLKPENILLDDKMHILLADFGSAKIMSTRHDVSDGLSNADVEQNLIQKQEQMDAEAENNQGRRRNNSFVGTAQYVSPEVLKGQATSRFTDLWALGCIIYQMISGLPPFRAATDYLIFQKVLKLEMSFPEGFDKDGQNLVQALVQIDPSERLGSRDMGDTYESIRRHPFFDSIDWDAIRREAPPTIHPHLPGLNDDESKQYRVPDNITPGLGEEQLRRLIGIELGTQTFEIQTKLDVTTSDVKKNTAIQNVNDREKQLVEQAKNNRWHHFADGELILKQGFVNKRKGLFARKRMLLLTTGPRLIYIDPVQMVKKGEIPWSPELKTEPKNFKIFFVHTPNRTYYLDDPEGYALSWCKAIDEVKADSYNKVK